MLISDGAAANQLAARFVLTYFQRKAAQREQQLPYFLLPYICANHQANLAVATAISGSRLDDAADLVATCSRLYKDLIPDYLEEF